MRCPVLTGSIERMFIINTNSGTTRMYEPWMAELDDIDPVDDLPGDERGVTFGQPTRIKQAVGERLIEQYAAIERYESDSGNTEAESNGVENVEADDPDATDDPTEEESDG